MVVIVIIIIAINGKDKSGDDGGGNGPTPGPPGPPAPIPPGDNPYIVETSENEIDGVSGVLVYQPPITQSANIL